MEQITDKIQQINNQINVVEELLERTMKSELKKKKNKFGNHEQLRGK
jgi:hypothetical protein